MFGSAKLNIFHSIELYFICIWPGADVLLIKNHRKGLNKEHAIKPMYATLAVGEHEKIGRQVFKKKSRVKVNKE